MTRFVGDGQPWAPQIIQDRLRVALQQEPVGQVRAVRWFTDQEPGEAVGLTVSTRWGEGVEVGYWVFPPPEHWGRGVARPTVDLAVAIIPEIYGQVRLVTRIDPANAASTSVLTRRRFGLEGRMAPTAMSWCRRGNWQEPRSNRPSFPPSPGPSTRV